MEPSVSRIPVHLMENKSKHNSKIALNETRNPLNASLSLESPGNQQMPLSHLMLQDSLAEASHVDSFRFGPQALERRITIKNLGKTAENVEDFITLSRMVSRYLVTSGETMGHSRPSQPSGINDFASSSKSQQKGQRIARDKHETDISKHQVTSNDSVHGSVVSLPNECLEPNNSPPSSSTPVFPQHTNPKASAIRAVELDPHSPRVWASLVDAVSTCVRHDPRTIALRRALGPAPMSFTDYQQSDRLPRITIVKTTELKPTNPVTTKERTSGFLSPSVRPNSIRTSRRFDQVSLKEGFELACDYLLDKKPYGPNVTFTRTSNNMQQWLNQRDLIQHFSQGILMPSTLYDDTTESTKDKLYQHECNLVLTKSDCIEQCYRQMMEEDALRKTKYHRN